MSTQTPTHDVVILGSGIAGSTLGAVLARSGASVLIADAGTHPRFAVGESMIPQLVSWLQVLAERYDVPEFEALTDVTAINTKVSNTFGRKQHFGFMLHRPGQEPDPTQAHQFVIPDALTSASHLFRQDSDAYLLRVAIGHGCDTRQQWRAEKIDFDDDGVTVIGTDGHEIRARYLVDASGFRSPLADHLGLREEPARFRHHSRSLFTHMIGVRPFDDVIEVPEASRPPVPWHNGTMHHIFERGWFWIIPFDNHELSRNPLCSVGVTLDPRLYPKPEGVGAEEEFAALLSRFPAVERQFEGARKVREWVSTGRLQYSSHQTVGRRWCLMSHAAGFLDPLYSRGMSNTFEIIHALAPRLLAALADDDFEEKRFRHVEDLEQGLLDYNDTLVNCSFIAFSHFRLWDAVFRVWGSGNTPGTLRINNALRAFRTHRDPSVFDALENAPHTGLWWPDNDAFKTLLDATAETCAQYEAKLIDGDRAADIILGLIEESEAVHPGFGWKDVNQRFIHPDRAQIADFLQWAARSPIPALSTIGRESLDALRAAGAAESPAAEGDR
ncbi:FADH2 O2-dependent halogenase [Streptomyces sp. yr375]|uniref:NAD(P)/FAD-dependent oxidoreductase n=1 Tax=Streptomyces sp. yr375 TaxID=1761906 RepID=UPI0008B4A49D|nr:tryptophan 7-halogenase [Streptomyces sp. yr375]SEQ07778.1 FADH2 O2-dependent halogenase [Streptomyces sp. yr375]